MPSGKKYNPIQRTNNGRVPFSVNANELQRAIRGMPSVNGNPGNSVSQFGNSFNIVNNLPPRFTIKILSGTNPYAWEAVIDDTANTWSTFNDGPAGTTSSIPAYEINGNAAVPANTLVDAWFGANYEVIYFEYGGESSFSSATITIGGTGTEVIDIGTTSTVTLTTTIGGDTVTIGGDNLTIIEGDSTVKIGGDSTEFIVIGGDNTTTLVTTIEGDTVTVGGDNVTVIGGDSITVGDATTDTIKIGTDSTVTLTTIIGGDSISLTGGNLTIIDADTVTVGGDTTGNINIGTDSTVPLSVVIGDSDATITIVGLEEFGETTVTTTAPPGKLQIPALDGVTGPPEWTGVLGEIATDGFDIYINDGTDWNTVGGGGGTGGTSKWVRFDVDESDFTAAATTETITLATLGQNVFVEDMVYRVTEIWDGGISLNPFGNILLEDGTTTLDEAGIDLSVLSGTRTGYWAPPVLMAYAADSVLKFKVTDSAENVANYTQGQISIWIKFTALAKP